MTEGLFGDDAVIRRIVREGALLAGGGCATILQVAHPGVGQGVADHSDFTDRPLDRLEKTLQYVYGVVFGTREEARRISAAVHAMHGRVTGPGYSANDPDLQVWVNATLYHTGLRLYGEIFGPLPDRDADEAYEQYAVLATSIGCPAGAWPENRAAFADYWDGMVGSIEVNDAGRRITRELLHPANPPALLRPLGPVNRFVTVGLLPQRIRGQLGLSWSPGRDVALRVALRSQRLVYPGLPVVVRQAPKTYYLGTLRQRLNKPRRRTGRPVAA
jgi:uncharacterized protein (DUF2236 family)